ncbi:MAG TPA: PAS domain-containing protein [Candidatus Paceibacterota bacterium]|nr:PAS domain-containing protein [Verrucomicrobiota bacterium]HRY51234.1 PAS domain-containing protein [Candidatus Paceibacterota bacterium]
MTTRPLQILLVEDEPAHAEAIRRTLNEATQKMEVRVVGSLREYAEAIAPNSPDLAILDLILPDGRAESVLTAPPEDGAFPQVVMTSHGDEHVAVAAIQRGALDYIVKSPEAFADMPHTVKRAMRSWQLLMDRKQAQHALRESEERMQRALRVSRSYTFEWRPATDGVLRSASCAAILGLFGEEAVHGTGQQYFQRVHPEDRTQFVQMLKALTPAASSYTAEYRLIRPDGSVVVLEEAGQATFDRTGQMDRLVGVATDITTRKQAESALRESEERLRLALEAAQMGTFDSDLVGNRVTWSRRHQEIWGMPPGEFTGPVDAFLRQVHPEDRAGIQTVWEHCVSSRSPFRHEYRVVWPDASVHWVEAAGEFTFDATGRPIRLRGTVVETTQNRRADEQLRASEERYRHLVETAFDWIWEVDTQGRYTFASPKVHNLLGYASEEVLGRTPFELMPETEAQRVGAVFNEIVAKRAPFSSFENLNRHKDGHLVVFETSGVPVFGPGGEFVGYRGMDRDVTDRKRLESQLRQTQKLEAIGQLAGGIAHDFNNILAAIMMHLGLLQMNKNLDEETRHALKDLDESARGAASLTRQLLMFSRRSVLSVKPLDLNEVVANLLKMLGRLIGEHIDLRFDGKTGLSSVPADAGMIEQVVMNLVVNARDAMPNGGRITLTTAPAEFGESEIAQNPARQPGRFVCLAVSDTGIGMDEATMKRIFEPFFTTKESGKGTGLGLATVHGIVGQHKGWIEVESQIGQGSTFRVFLPAEAHPSGPTQPAAPETPIQRGRETVLLVEDDTKVRQMIGQTLRILGYRVYEAANGQEAMGLWLTHSRQVDLLFTDMVMPEGMTGLELTERLQATRPDLKAIISSGYSAEIVQAGVPNKAGVVYLPKPYEAQTLAEVVRNCLDQKK